MAAPDTDELIKKLRERAEAAPDGWAKLNVILSKAQDLYVPASNWAKTKNVKAAVITYIPGQAQNARADIEAFSDDAMTPESRIELYATRTSLDSQRAVLKEMAGNIETYSIEPSLSSKTVTFII